MSREYPSNLCYSCSERYVIYLGTSHLFLEGIFFPENLVTGNFPV